MTVDKRFFDNMLSSRNLSLRRLADKMDMTHSQLSLTFSGTRRMQLEEAAKMARIFGVPLARIAVAAGVTDARSAGRHCKVTGILRGDGTVTENAANERTIAPDGLPENVEAIQARTANSALAWLDGWVFFCQPMNSMDSGSLGRFCMLELEDNRRVIATVRRGYHDDRYALTGPYSNEDAPVKGATAILVTRH